MMPLKPPTEYHFYWEKKGKPFSDVDIIKESTIEVVSCIHLENISKYSRNWILRHQLQRQFAFNNAFLLVPAEFLSFMYIYIYIYIYIYTKLTYRPQNFLI